MSRQSVKSIPSANAKYLGVIGLENEIGTKDFNFKILKTYNDVAILVTDLIKLAEKEIYLASRYYEPVVGSKLVQKFSEGVLLNILDGNSSGTTFVERIKEVARLPTKDGAIFKRLLESPNARIQSAKVGYSIVVVDRAYSAFEVVDPLNPDVFNFAVQTEEPKVAERLIEIFREAARESRGPT